jgi:hypothetical protein
VAADVAAIYLLTAVLVIYSLYGSIRQRHDLVKSVKEPLVKRHLMWHSLALLSVTAFYELPIAAFLLAIPAGEYALLRSFVFSFFIVAAFLSIKPLFDLSHAYSFSVKKPVATELVLFFFMLAATMLALSMPSLAPAQAYPVAVAVALATATGAVLYYYAGMRLGASFNEPNLKAYLPAHALLMLSVLLLSQLDILLRLGLIPDSMVQLLGVIGLLAFVAIVEIDKAISWKHIKKFVKRHSFDSPVAKEGSTGEAGGPASDAQ